VFLYFSGSKLAAYVLPAVPAVSLLVGERIVCYLKQKRGHLVLRLTGACLLILIIAVVWVAHRNLGFDITRPALALSPVGLVACLALIRPQLRKPLIFLIALVPMVTAMMMLRPLAPVIARRESVRDLLGVAAARGYSNTPLVMLHTLERTSEFYAAGRISYDSDGEPSWFETVAEVVAAAHNNDGLVLCIVPVEYQSQLRSTDQMETQVIGDNGQVALVVVRVR
jgi:4-amino-4-deoxy-L-arabinose transferase-like glycosyltransferase